MTGSSSSDDDESSVSSSSSTSSSSNSEESTTGIDHDGNSRSKGDSHQPQHSAPSSDDETDSSQSLSKHERDSSNTQHLVLSERIKMQQQSGVDLGPVRQRRSNARLIAGERLSQLKGQPIKEKRSKNAPTEMSSRRSDFRRASLNQSGVGVDIGAHRYKPRDPRISNLTGHLDMDHFERNYSFLQDVQEKDIATLRQRIEAATTTGKKGQSMRRRFGLVGNETLDVDRATLKELLQDKANFERNQIDRVAKRSVKKKMQEQVAEGKRGAFFLKRKERKRQVLEAKFEEIRKRGGDQAVDKVLAKRRKKNKSRDSGFLGGRSHSSMH